MRQNHVANPPQTIWQPELCPELPCIYGPLDYHLFRDLLVEIDRLLLAGIEARFVTEALALLPPDANATACARCAKHAVLALRCNIARKLTTLDYRDFAVQGAPQAAVGAARAHRPERKTGETNRAAH
jgi:hypothetical protein